MELMPEEDGRRPCLKKGSGTGLPGKDPAGVAVEARRHRGVARRGRPPLLKAEAGTIVGGAPEVDNSEEQQGWGSDDGTVTAIDLAQRRPVGGRSSQARSGSSSRARPSGMMIWVRCRLGEASED